ncbi:MAG: hypothetical protein CMJ81_01105 [Planctomycetaceae bacterium]|nr:hypothetical protein [Planctomycetaceae bacterium]MBP62625.1 hypothetical protein [Planctomycetaceae bacterium]
MSNRLIQLRPRRRTPDRLRPRDGLSVQRQPPRIQIAKRHGKKDKGRHRLTSNPKVLYVAGHRIFWKRAQFFARELQLTAGTRRVAIFLTLLPALIKIKELTFTRSRELLKLIQVLGSFRLGDCHSAIVKTKFPSTFFCAPVEIKLFPFNASSGCRF